MLTMRTQASLPANVRVNPVRWFGYYPKWPVIWLGSFAFFAALALAVGWGFWIPAGLLFIMNVLYWIRVREHFRNGCANPAVIVQMHPMLIAVATDVSQGIGNYPVIKIFQKHLRTVNGQPPQLGALLPTSVLYQQSPDDNVHHWVECHPRPIECATGDLGAIQQTMMMIPQVEWNQMMQWLQFVPRPFRPGLYYVGQYVGAQTAEQVVAQAHAQQQAYQTYEDNRPLPLA